MTYRDLAAYVDAASTAIELHLTGEQRAGAIENLAILASFAELLRTDQSHEAGESAPEDGE